MLETKPNPSLRFRKFNPIEGGRNPASSMVEKPLIIAEFTCEDVKVLMEMVRDVPDYPEDVSDKEVSSSLPDKDIYVPSESMDRDNPLPVVRCFSSEGEILMNPRSAKIVSPLPNKIPLPYWPEKGKDGGTKSALKRLEGTGRAGIVIRGDQPKFVIRYYAYKSHEKVLELDVKVYSLGLIISFIGREILEQVDEGKFNNPLNLSSLGYPGVEVPEHEKYIILQLIDKNNN